MPRLLEKDDVMQTAVNLGRAEKVWSEQLVTDSGDMTFKLPEGGIYQVICSRLIPRPTSSVRQRKIPAKSISAALGLTIPSLSATVQNFTSKSSSIVRRSQTRRLSGIEPQVDFIICGIWRRSDYMAVCELMRFECSFVEVIS